MAISLRLPHTRIKAPIMKHRLSGLKHRWADRFLYPYLHDRPLAGAPRPDRPYHPRLYACEFAATTILMVFGLSTNILLGASSSPIGQFFVHMPVLLVVLQGLFFGMGGSLGALSPFGRVSGGHLNPSVSFAFMLTGKLLWRDTVGYMLGQIGGAFFGTFLVALVGHVWPSWKAWSLATHYSATIPTQTVPIFWPLIGEICATAALINLILFFGSRTKHFWQQLTPWLIGPLYCLMNPFEAWLSGDSTNLARSLAPAFASYQWSNFWIYCVGPFTGAALVVGMARLSSVSALKIREARIAYFGHRGYAPYLIPPEIPMEEQNLPPTPAPEHIP